MQLLRHWTEVLRDLGLPEQERKPLTIHDFASLSISLQAMDFRSGGTAEYGREIGSPTRQYRHRHGSA
jgi:hypothetical protein